MSSRTGVGRRNFGLYYYRARYYDQYTGKFLSEDPIRFVGGIDFYRYVSNSPVLLIDPMGLCGDDAPSAWAIFKNLNSCAAPLAQSKSLSALSGGRIPGILGGNTFSDLANLATGQGGLDEGAALGAHGAQEIGLHAAGQLTVGTVTSIGLPISAVSGVYNPITVGTASQSLGGTVAGRIGLNFLKGASEIRIGWDAAMYLAAEAACAAEAFQ